MFRITLGRLMLVIVAVSLGLVALSRPSPLWASFVFTAALAVMLAAVIGSLARQGRARVAMLGFAMFGWIHLAVSFGPWPWLNNDGLRPPRLVTGHLINYLEYHLFKFHVTPSSSNIRTRTTWSDAKLVLAEPGGYSFEEKIGPVIHITDSPSDQIMHSFSSILFGFLGAGLSLLAAGPRDRTSRGGIERNTAEGE